jgi:antitoxin HigA-1
LINADSALRLGRYFGIDAEFWLRLHTGYDISIARHHPAAIDRDVQPLSTGG